MLVGAFESGAHGVDGKVSGSGFIPGGAEAIPVIGVVAVHQGDAAFDADRGRVATVAAGQLPHLGDTFLTGAVGLELREPTVAHAGDAANHLGCATAEPDRDGLLDGAWVDTGVGDFVVTAFEVDYFLGPEHPQNLDLLGGTAAAIVPILAEGLVLHVVPTDADAQPQATAGEDIYLGGLLGDQGGLTLGRMMIPVHISIFSVTAAR